MGLFHVLEAEYLEKQPMTKQEEALFVKGVREAVESQMEILDRTIVDLGRPRGMFYAARGAMKEAFKEWLSQHSAEILVSINRKES